jgi:hypothetical protein
VWKLAGRGAETKTGAQTSAPAGNISGRAGMVTRVLAIAFCVMILAGHGYTNYRELQKAPYREAYGENIANAALQYEILSDDEIRETFDYRKGREESAADVRRALRILKENHWNIFSRVEY